MFSKTIYGNLFLQKVIPKHNCFGNEIVCVFKLCIYDFFRCLFTLPVFFKTEYLEISHILHFLNTSVIFFSKTVFKRQKINL